MNATPEYSDTSNNGWQRHSGVMRCGYLRSDLDPDLTARALRAMFLAAIEHAAHAAAPAATGAAWIETILAIVFDGLHCQQG